MKNPWRRDRPRLCRRHTWALYVAAFGSLLDLTGRMYLRAGKQIFAEVRACDACQSRGYPPSMRMRPPAA